MVSGAEGRTFMEVGADGVALITFINPPINSLSFDGTRSFLIPLIHIFYFLFFYYIYIYILFIVVVSVLGSTINVCMCSSCWWLLVRERCRRQKAKKSEKKIKEIHLWCNFVHHKCILHLICIIEWRYFWVNWLVILA
jgi:hypothetical protein